MQKAKEKSSLIKGRYSSEKANILPEVSNCLDLLEEASKATKEKYPSSYKSFEDTGRCYLIAGGFPRDIVSHLQTAPFTLTLHVDLGKTKQRRRFDLFPKFGSCVHEVLKGQG